MKRIAILFVTILIVLLLIAAGFFFLRKTPAQSPGGTGTTFPGSGTQGTGGSTGGSASLKTITTYDHKSLSVNDFTKDASVQADPNVQGQYDIAGGVTPTASTAYQIFYQTTDDYFGITLYKEPLGQNRIAAENQLMQKLGITKEAMCSLSYDVSPGPGVNTAYDGKNLGFSFCPGAVQLP